VNVLHAQARIRLVEPDRLPIGSRREVNELLEKLSAWRRWRILGELEYQIENLSNILGEVGDVLVEGSVIYGKETNLFVFQRNELCKVGCADFVQVCGRSMSPSPKEQFYLCTG
jgi:hypothetical protein